MVRKMIVSKSLQEFSDLSWQENGSVNISTIKLAIFADCCREMPAHWCVPRRGRQSPESLPHPANSQAPASAQ